MPFDRSRDSDSLIIEVFKEDNSILFHEQHKIGDEEALEKQRSYRNFDCMSFYIHDKTYHELNLIGDAEMMMRFYTDYFNFLYPDVGPDNVMAAMAYVHPLEDDYVEYCFYPDGSEDSEEKLKEFMEARNNWSV